MKAGRAGLRRRATLAWLGAAGVAWVAAGCTNPRMAPLNLAEPGWRLRESEAVWRPAQDAPELMGELLVAHHDDGRRWIQFSKQGLPWITARQGGGAWRIESPLRRRGAGGRGRPPGRVPWFLLDDLPPSDPPGHSPWRLQRWASGWRLSNEATGEAIEGSNP